MSGFLSKIVETSSLMSLSAGPAYKRRTDRKLGHEERRGAGPGSTEDAGVYESEDDEDEPLNPEGGYSHLNDKAEDDNEDVADGSPNDSADDSDGQEMLLSTLRGLVEERKAEETKVLEGMSAHERRVKRMAERARKLEEENMGEKDWHMRGETRAGVRPLSPPENKSLATSCLSTHPTASKCN